MEEPKQEKLEPKYIAVLWGYDCGLIWEYKNPYPKEHPLWSAYLYGYVLGVVNIMPEDS